MEVIDWNSDKVSSISSMTGRLIVDGMRAAQVRPNSSSKDQISALMDLLDLQMSEVDAGRPVDPKRVTLRVPTLTSEAQGALGTLRDAVLGDMRIRILEMGPNATWVPADLGWDQADLSEYSSWKRLLGRPRPIPALLTEIAHAAGDPSLRAYPMLSTANGWSLRLEGLEVARVTDTRATLNVGKDGRTGNQSRQRKAWIAATGRSEPVETGDANEAAQLIASFAKEWGGLGAKTDQDEHALESRILRGEATIVARGKRLELIDPNPVVNWGSQFPTKWGPGGQARYLDALLRDGSTPWAIEMKVQGAGGVGQYYRHAVAQAVLYREFIRRATSLHGWFAARGLVAADCQAAVAVPQMTHPKHVPWRANVVRLCEAFGVAFVEVDPKHARRHRVLAATPNSVGAE